MDFIELDGVVLRDDLSGKGDRTLVLVHEIGDSLESWDDVARRGLLASGLTPQLGRSLKAQGLNAPCIANASLIFQLWL